MAGLGKVEQWLAKPAPTRPSGKAELRGCQMGQRPVRAAPPNDVTNRQAQFLIPEGRAKPLSARAYINGMGTSDPSPEKGREYRRTIPSPGAGSGFEAKINGGGKVTLACEKVIVEAVDNDLKNVLPKLKSIHRILFDVFGFSRGAAAARPLC